MTSIWYGILAGSIVRAALFDGFEVTIPGFAMARMGPYGRINNPVSIRLNDECRKHLSETPGSVLCKDILGLFRGPLSIHKHF
jgi:hypothetical protein